MPRKGHSVLPRIRAELTDEVRYINKKEDLHLEKKLRIIDHQKRAAHSLLRKSLNDVIRLDASIHDDSCRSTDLVFYDMRKYKDKLACYYSDDRGLSIRNPINVRLPPLPEVTSEHTRLHRVYGEIPTDIAKLERACATERVKMGRKLENFLYKQALLYPTSIETPSDKSTTTQTNKDGECTESINEEELD